MSRGRGVLQRHAELPAQREPVAAGALALGPHECLRAAAGRQHTEHRHGLPAAQWSAFAGAGALHTARPGATRGARGLRPGAEVRGGRQGLAAGVKPHGGHAQGLCAPEPLGQEGAAAGDGGRAGGGARQAEHVAAGGLSAWFKGIQRALELRSPVVAIPLSSLAPVSGPKAFGFLHEPAFQGPLGHPGGADVLGTGPGAAQRASSRAVARGDQAIASEFATAVGSRAGGVGEII